MSFLSPEYFWLLLFLVAGFMKKDFKQLRFVSYGYILTFIFIILALSRPVLEQEPIKTEQILSDVIIAVDLSYSMHSDDIKPTRLKHAKEILNDLVKIKQNFRFGVLGFTTNAIVLSPLTQDNELLLHLFSVIDEKLIITKGSGVMPALKLAKKMSKSKNPIVLILSDGTDGKDFQNEISFARENRLIVNIFMLGTKLGGTLLLDNGELLRDDNDDIVVTRENEKISQISNATNGIYTKDLGELISALESQKNKDFKSKTTIVQNFELFYLFIVLAILSFLVSVTTLKKYLITFLLLFGVNLNAGVFDYFKDENRIAFEIASEYYRDGEYEKALVHYETVKSANSQFKSSVYFNIANSFVRLKEFKKARENYLKSLTLFYSIEADENLRYIKNVSEEKIMKTGQQKSDKKSSMAKKEQSGKKRKEGGASNMKVSANVSDGAGDIGKKTESDQMLSLDSSKARLSSKQYELINKRGVDEISPW